MDAQSAGRPRRRILVAGLCTAVVGALMAVLGLLVGGTAAFADPAVAQCLARSQGVTVHFILSDPTPPVPAVAGTVLDGFDSQTCDGQPVLVTLSGNPAGDPSGPATVLLSTLDSTRDPCTDQSLPNARVITGGSITLHGCAGARSAGAAYADIHDLTRLSVKVSGQEITAHQGPPMADGAHHGSPTGSGSAPDSAPGSATGPVQPGSGGSLHGATSALLPFTGGPSALILWLGLVLVLCGIVMTVPVRRLVSARRRFAERGRRTTS